MKDNLLNALDLFSGIAGNSIALKKYIKTVAYCEADRHAQSVLLSRMGDGSLEVAPIWDDIKTLKGAHINVPIDIIVAGFPCQDISCAGNGEGLEGKRSGLFFEVVRLIEEIKPPFVFLENVPAIRTRGLSRVCWELASLGYDLRWTNVSAAELGAPHLRNRWFLLAYADGLGLRDRGKWIKKGKAKTNFKLGNNGTKKPLADSNSKMRAEYGAIGRKQENSSIKYTSWWKIEPDVDRVVNELPYRVDRIKRLGNAVVPACAKEAFERLLGL